MVIIKTTFGDITLSLDAEKAPATVANFLKYAREGYYGSAFRHGAVLHQREGQ